MQECRQWKGVPLVTCIGLLTTLWTGVACGGTAQSGNQGSVSPASPVSEQSLETSSSLELVMRCAAEHNPAIRSAQHAWEAARQRITQQRSYANPLVTYDADTGNMTETRSGPQGNAVGFSQAISFPGKLTLRGNVADQEARATYERLQAVIQEVSRQTRARFADYYLAMRSLAINADTTELARQFAAIAEAKYRVGTAAQQDVILAQEQLSRLATERVGFEGDQETALGGLNALLDRPPRAPIGAPSDLQAQELAITLDDLVTSAHDTRPELKAQNHFVAASRDALRLAKMGYLPDFSVGAQYVEIGGGTNPSFPKDGHDVWMAKLGFSVPIWIDRVHAEVNEKRALVLQEESRRRDLTNQVYDQVQRAYERVRVAARTEKIYRATLVPQTQERIAAARAGYQTGVVDFLTLIDSLKSLEDVRLERDRAVRSYQQALADLERAVGKPIAENRP
jgi:cobalt-zinc-cadmium efflux system outer membrane protein